MKKIVPQKNNFNTAKKLNKWVAYSNVAVLIISVISIINSELLSSFIPNSIIYFFAIVFAISTVVLESLFESYFRKAENTRRDALFDNAFSTKMADIESKGYFDTDVITPGIKKLLANTHENCFFSERIVTKMFNKSLIKNLILLMITIALIVFNFLSYDLTLVIINLFLSANFVIELVNLCRLKDDITKTLENCKAIATNTDCPDNIAKIFREVLRYETALSYCSIIFDSKIYNDINPPTTIEWNKIMDRYYK